MDREHPVRGGVCLAIALALVSCSPSSAVTTTHVTAGPAVSQVGGLMYYLPKRVLELTVWEYTFREKLADGSVRTLAPVRYATVDATATVPDRNYLMRLVHRPSPSFHDNVSVAITPEGLLTSVRTTFRDESPAIVAKLAELAGTVAKAGLPAPKGTTPGLSSISVTPIRRRLATVVVDPTDAAACAAALGRYGVHLTAEPLLGSEDVRCTLAPPGPCQPVCTQAGVCYRPVIPYRITVRPGGIIEAPPPGSREGPTHDIVTGGTQQILMLPNRSPVVCYPIERTAFVRRTLSMSFDNGLLTSMTTDKPSEILGFLSIPIDVAKAIVSIPGELLQLRITRIDQRKALSSSEAAALQSLQDLQKAKASSAGTVSDTGGR